jgi:hypothetical protein
MIARKTLIGSLALLALSTSTGDAYADSMRCGHRIVATGDSLHVVHSVCGEPTARQQRFETWTELKRVVVDCGTSKTPHRRCERVQRVAREVRIDEWTYDFGPRRFIQYLTFADGRLMSVEVGGRGSRNPSNP